MSIFCGRSHKPVRRLKYDWPLPNPVRCPFSIWAPMERWGRQNVWLIVGSCFVLFTLRKPGVFVCCSTSLRLWAAACTCTAFWPRRWWPTGRSPTTLTSYIPCCYLTGSIRHFQAPVANVSRLLLLLKRRQRTLTYFVNNNQYDYVANHTCH